MFSKALVVDTIIDKARWLAASENITEAAATMKVLDQIPRLAWEDEASRNG